jgi:hypothetical protein
MIRRPVRPGQPVNTTIAGHVHMVVPVQTVRMPVSQGRRFSNRGAARIRTRGGSQGRSSRSTAMGHASACGEFGAVNSLKPQPSMQFRRRGTWRTTLEEYRRPVSLGCRWALALVAAINCTDAPIPQRYSWDCSFAESPAWPCALSASGQHRGQFAGRLHSEFLVEQPFVCSVLADCIGHVPQSQVRLDH